MSRNLAEKLAGAYLTRSKTRAPQQVAFQYDRREQNNRNRNDRAFRRNEEAVKQEKKQAEQERKQEAAKKQKRESRIKKVISDISRIKSDEYDIDGINFIVLYKAVADGLLANIDASIIDIDNDKDINENVQTILGIMITHYLQPTLKNNTANIGITFDLSVENNREENSKKFKDTFNHTAKIEKIPVSPSNKPYDAIITAVEELFGGENSKEIEGYMEAVGVHAIGLEVTIKNGTTGKGFTESIEMTFNKLPQLQLCRAKSPA